MTEAKYCQTKTCIYRKKGGCTRKSVLLDDEEHCMNIEDDIPMRDISNATDRIILVKGD